MKQSYLRMSMTFHRFWRQLDYMFAHAVVVVDQEDRIAACSKSFLEASGYGWAELEGARLCERLGLSLQDGTLGVARSEAAVDEPPVQVAEVRCASGRLSRSRFFTTVLETEDRVGCTLLHLLDLHCSDDGLSLLQRFAGTLMRDIHLGVILFDPAFRLIEISDKACRLLGWERRSVMNRSMDEVFGGMPEEHRLVQRSIFDGLVVRNHAISWTNNQERYELLLDSSLLRDPAGQVVGGYITFKDVTSLRSLEEQVQRSDRLAMIGQIAAGAAHEIRNPLTSVKGFLQMFRSTFSDLGMDKERSYAELMLTEIDRINELVNEFLLLSKRKDVSYRQVPLSQTLREILPIIHGEAMLHGVAVQEELEPDLPVIVADGELLKQVFLNISKNGIEAMMGGGRLTVTARKELAERRVVVEIHDTGPGIPHFVIDKIFDPFFTTKPEGTGLGLSVCQRIVHDMGGSIRVSSKGFGTTFSVTLPLP